MLETIKQTIKNVPFISFEEYFIQYMMDIQDSSIDDEVSFMLKNNSLTTLDVDRLIHHEVITNGK